MDNSIPSKGLISLPIDFLDVGLLKNRTFKPMGLLTLESIDNINYAELLQKVKTVSARQLTELQAKSSDDIRVYIRHLTMDSGNDKAKFAGYVGRLTTATTKSLEHFLQTTLKHNLSLQVEVWLKNDMNNPSEYFRNLIKTPERDAAATVLKVEATQLDDDKTGTNANTLTETSGKTRFLYPRLLTSHCVRAFRKDLENRLLFCSGIYKGPIWNTSYKVDIYFKRKVSSRQSMVAAAAEKSKDTFEECVFSCLEKGKPMKLQYRIKPANPSNKTTPPAVPVKDVRNNDLFFGSKTSFGNQPASTAPSQTSVPSSGSPFNQYIRSAPLRMSDAGSATSFKTLHDGFYEAVKQASQSKVLLAVPVQSTAEKAQSELQEAIQKRKTALLSKVEASVQATRSMAKVPEATARLQAEAEQHEVKEAKGKESSRVGSNSLALKQVESMLTKFMINLNQTLLDNFGDDASTLSILHDSEDHAPKEEDKVPKKESSRSDTKPKSSRASGHKHHFHHTGSTKGVRHNAYCNLCNHIIVGNRHKCANCPDWDCCDKCRITANETHPGHSFMKIDSLDILTQSVHPSDWVVHPNVYCDGCDGKLLGPRFKCIGCDDFDWCVDCEADPSKKHDLGNHHVFLKINKPMSSSCRIDHFVMQAQEIIGEMQERSNFNLQEQQKETQQKWNKFGIHGSKTSEEQNLIEKEVKTPWIDNVADGERKEQATSVSVLVPDLLYPDEAKKEMEPTETDLKKAAIDGDWVHRDLSVVHERLSTLYNDAQKLPGAQIATVESPIKTQAVTTSPPTSTSQDDKEDYDMEVIGDVNMPDGTRVLAGSQFEKLWTVKNIGKRAWPISTQLRLTLSSNGVNTDRIVAPFQTSVLPQQSINVGVNDLDAGERLGNHHFYFRFELPAMGKAPGKRFGQQLWCQVEVIDGSHSNSDSFISSRGNKGDEWEHQESLLASSLFHLPNAPESLATASETGTNAPTAAEPLTETEEVDAMSLTSSEDDDEDFEIIEPSSDGEDDDESYL